MKLSLPVESVRERDIDFLLTEEFISSPRFINFFINTLSLPACDEMKKVERSINDFSKGETDILVGYVGSRSKIAILIENKLDAFFQPRQAKRYLERALEYERQKIYDKAFVVLVAPAQYIERQNDFSLCLSYEQIMEYFTDSELKERGTFKIQLLKIATEKLRRGYVAINSEPNRSFWQNYRYQLGVDAPIVSMKPVSVVPANSDWIELYAGKQKIIHKLAKGYLDFVSPTAEFEEKVTQSFGGHIEKLEFKSGKILRFHTAPLSRLAPFEEQLKEYAQCTRDLNKIILFLCEDYDPTQSQYS